MLRDYKTIYEKKASIIPNWKCVDKNVLINQYIEHEKEPELADSYLSAILCRYWGLIDKYYLQSYHSVPVEEVYDWLIHAVLYALKHRKWKDPNNKLYTDPNGPDKVINRCMLSSRRIFYQAANYDLRSLNYKTSSLDAAMEARGDVISSEVQPYEDVEDCTSSMIKKYFDKGKYFTAFFIDGIANYEVFDKLKESGTYTFSKKRLVRHLKHLDNKYAKSFSERFNVSIDKVNLAVNEMNSLTRIRLYNRVEADLERLKTNKELIEAKC